MCHITDMEESRLMRRLKQAESEGLTQTVIAELIGVTPEAVNHWRWGRRTCPNGPFLVKLADALACEPRDLVEP